METAGNARYINSFGNPRIIKPREICIEDGRRAPGSLCFWLSLIAADAAWAAEKYILATGRKDPRIYAIDFNAALNPRNNNTPNAIVSHHKVLPDRLDGTPIGDPANIVLSEDKKIAYVINHHGAVNNAEFLQHGGRAVCRLWPWRR